MSSTFKMTREDEQLLTALAKRTGKSIKALQAEADALHRLKPGEVQVVDPHCTRRLVPETGEIELTFKVTRKVKRLFGLFAKHVEMSEEEFQTDMLRKLIAEYLAMTDEEIEQRKQKAEYEKLRELFEEVHAIEQEEMLYTEERIKAEAQADVARALTAKAEAGYLAVIAALAYALADCRPKLRKDGRPFVGYSKDTGDAGIVGYLKQNNYTERSSTDLEKKISAALKQAALS